MKKLTNVFEKLAIARLTKKLRAVEAKLEKAQARIAELNGKAPAKPARELQSCTVRPAMRPTAVKDTNTMVN